MNERMNESINESMNQSMIEQINTLINHKWVSTLPVGPTMINSATPNMNLVRTSINISIC